MKALEDLKALVEIPALSGQEHTAADWMEQRLLSEGCEVKRLGNNVWSTTVSFDPDLPTILLNSHLDTVPAANGWTFPPHELTVSGDRLIGLGANDAKASLVGLLHVFLEENAFRKSGKKRTCNWVFLASAEEENSGKGGMESVRNQLGNIDMAIVGEPTGGRVALAEKGLLVIDVEVKGVAGHAARNTGENAIYKSLETIERLRYHRFERVSELLGPVSLNVTMIEAGSAHNVVPDRCRFTMDIRLNECYTHVEILTELQQLTAAELHPRSMRLCASGLPENHPLELAARKLNLQCFGSPTMSDQALMPWPSVKMGIGESERSHTANEYITITELTEGIDRYRRFLTQLEYEIMG